MRPLTTPWNSRVSGAVRGVLLLALCAGCSASATGLGRPAPTVSVSAAVPPSLPFPPPSVASTTSSVVFAAVLTKPTPCYSVRATDRIEGRELIITLVAMAPDVSCVQVTAVAQYTVTSLDVPMTVTHVRVDQTGFVGSDPVLVDTDIRLTM